MPTLPCLLPTPRQLKLTGGIWEPANSNIILLEADHPQSLMNTAMRLRAALKSQRQQSYELYAGQAPGLGNIGIILKLAQQAGSKPQAYRLLITPAHVSIQAADEAGLFYGCCTLIQLFQSYGSLSNDKNDVRPGSLPCLEIEDWPDFPQRGVMLDVSRDKVPTMETLFDLVDLLASWKINQLQLNTEHAFAYQQHPEVWADASPLTGEEILKLDEFCRERYIELVPNQNSFGHLEKWLRLPRYKPLAETPDGFDFPWGRQEGPFSLCPMDEGSLTFLKSLYDELLPHFSSRLFNVGCDETFDLGQGRSKDECARIGSGRVYLNFLLQIYEEVKKRGFRMQFWGDILMAHPELVKELPNDSIALEWGYEADHPFDVHGEQLAQAGLSFYVCPGTSAWNSIAGRTDNCLANLANAAKNGLKHGADGYLITDWGDNGHWQALPVSYLGFAAGAAYAWAYQANQDLELRDALNRYAFHCPTNGLGDLAYSLGNVYRAIGIEPHNSSSLFHILQKPIGEWKNYIDEDNAIRYLLHTMEVIEQISQSHANFESSRDDSKLLQREFKQTIHLLRHACWRGLFGYGARDYSRKFLINDLNGIMEEHQQIWLKRNRPGGLRDSLSYFEKSRKAYL